MTKTLRNLLPVLCLWLCFTPTFAAPTLSLERILGDTRGRQFPGQWLSVAIAPSGTAYLLANRGTVALYDAQGQYLRTERVPLRWPLTHKYLCPVGSRVFSGDARQDFPWVFSPERVGSDPGRFQDPSGVALDAAASQVYVADTGNSRIQRFSLDDSGAPNLVLPLPAKPTAVAVHELLLAVLTADQALSLYDLSGAEPQLRASLRIGADARRVALGPGGAALVVCQDGQVLRFTYAGGKLTDAGVLAQSAMADWPQVFPASVPLETGPDGNLWFATDTFGKLLSLDPVTDKITDRGPAPYRTLCVGFGTGHTLYLGGYPPADGASLTLLQLPALNNLRPFPTTGTLYRESGAPIWGLLPAPDGTVYVRVVEEGYQKGWPALALKRVSPDGKSQPFLDFGNLYGKRTTFAPSELRYAMAFAADGTVVLTATALQAVYKVTPEGKIVWEASASPQGGAAKLELMTPRDLALDRAGNLWVVDGGSNQVLCLSPEGKLLLTWGRYGGEDDLSGEGFDQPSGIAVAEVEGVEYLYVGDAGNRRLLKYRLGA